MNLIIYFDGERITTCGFVGNLEGRAADYPPSFFGLPSNAHIHAIIKDWRQDQIVLLPDATVTLSR